MLFNHPFPLKRDYEIQLIQSQAFPIHLDRLIYTQTKVKQHNIFFGDNVLEVAKRNIWVMEIKCFEFYNKFYYFFEHLELKMILSTKYLDNLRPFTKQVKNDIEKQ